MFHLKSSFLLCDYSQGELLGCNVCLKGKPCIFWSGTQCKKLLKFCSMLFSATCHYP